MPDISITVEADAGQLELLYKRLDSVKAHKAIQAAVARTVKSATVAAGRVVRDKTTVQRKYIQRVIKSIPPHGDSLAGRVNIKKEPLPLIAFKVSASKRNGVRVTTRTDKPPIILKHAFKATMKTGHVGIYLRAKGRGKLAPSGFAKRLPIVEQYGPNIMSIISVPDILAELKGKISADLMKNLASQMSRFLDT